MASRGLLAREVEEGLVGDSPRQSGQGASHSPTGPWAPAAPLMGNTVAAEESLEDGYPASQWEAFSFLSCFFFFFLTETVRLRKKPECLLVFNETVTTRPKNVMLGAVACSVCRMNSKKNALCKRCFLVLQVFCQSPGPHSGFLS